jgi:hypothetical protein
MIPQDVRHQFRLRLEALRGVAVGRTLTATGNTAVTASYKTLIQVNQSFVLSPHRVLTTLPP